ncbi:zf-HC2 domain-containing protein [Caldanaerobacter subterraneus]|uniref:Zf-HC2 domain-containing protein n=1 Tax=Caldanaerobacter subterraneus TaxID=911092 RepID=A0A7Y2L7W9_9THEO|nr:zf-HC2 domain-containing protein [Caldanaerobacter subterraneus]
MKKKCKEIQNKIIDMHYGEIDENIEIISHIENCNDCNRFKEKLELALDYMKILDTQVDTSVLEIDITKIIEKAYQIENKRKEKFELLIFIAASIVFLISSVLFITNLDIRIYFYLQIFLYLNLPLILIPFYKLKTPRR